MMEYENKLNDALKKYNDIVKNRIWDNDDIRVDNDNDKNNKLLFEVLEEPDPPVPGLATHSNPDIAKLYLVYPDLHLCTHSVADDPVKV